MEDIKRFCFGVLLVLMGCSDTSGPLEFHPLSPFKYGKDSLMRTDYYVVKNLDVDDSLDVAQVDDFVLKKLPSDYAKYTSYQMLFYRYSSSGINEDYKHDAEELIEWQSEEVLLEYNWQHGKFIYVIVNPYNDKRKTIFKRPGLSVEDSTQNK